MEIFVEINSRGFSVFRLLPLLLLFLHFRVKDNKLINQRKIKINKIFFKGERPFAMLLSFLYKHLNSALIKIQKNKIKYKYKLSKNEKLIIIIKFFMKKKTNFQGK